MAVKSVHPESFNMSTSDKGNADRFIDAFKRIEDTLRKRLDDTDPDANYKTLIGEAAKIGYGPVKTYQQRLHTFGYLRNAIVHKPESPDKEVIARPRTDIVEEIEEIAGNIESPPTIDKVYRDAVYSVLGNQPVTKIASEMKKKDFSQAPVKHYDGKFRTLLTTNSISRWFAEAVQEEGDLSKATVDDVIDHRERADSYEVLGPSATLFDVLSVFDPDMEDHIPPYAAVITHDGNESGKVRGILTPYDLPLVYDEIAPSHRRNSTTHSNE